MIDGLDMIFASGRRTLLTAFAFMASIATLHCSSDRDAFDDASDGAPGPSSFADASAVVDQGDAEAPIGDCENENKLIYVLSYGPNELFRFDPLSLEFIRIGRVQCPTQSSTNSMAVDRRGTAWVSYNDGRLFKVSTKDGSCEPTSFQPIRAIGNTFGMGFARDETSPDTAITETLFVQGNTLGRLDRSTFETSIIGTKESQGLGELTGTGDGTLYAFLRMGNRIVRFDKTDGAILETFRPDVDDFNAWAVATWGGDFWMFTAKATGMSKVIRYSPFTDTTRVVVENAGRRLVGAGVSTCAPTTPPR